MKMRMAPMRSGTLVKVPRRMAWRVMMPKKISINRPWVAESSVGGSLGVSGESGEVAFDACDDAGVAGDFGVPAAFGGVVAQRGCVGELGLQRGDELGCADEVVALLADVGVWAGLGCQLAGAVAVRDAGLEHFLA